MTNDYSYWTEDGIQVPSVTESQMREIDHIATQDFGLGILQMMENAGRVLAMHALDMLRGRGGGVVILAGPGGNGGGGLCCARHLINRGLEVQLLLSCEPDELSAAATNQYSILHQAGIKPLNRAQAEQAIRNAGVTVDALIGYSLRNAPHGTAANWIQLCNQHAWRVLSLDLPSGVDATSGETFGIFVQAERVLTLALPKTGLHNFEGDLFVADLGIPSEVFLRLGLQVEPFFGEGSWVRLEKMKPNQNRE